MVGTIVRRRGGREWESVIGQDVSEERARDLVESGGAEWGPDRQLPPALYLAIDLEIRGWVYPAGSMLTVGLISPRARHSCSCTAIRRSPAVS